MVDMGLLATSPRNQPGCDGGWVGGGRGCGGWRVAQVDQYLSSSCDTKNKTKKKLAVPFHCEQGDEAFWKVASRLLQAGHFPLARLPDSVHVDITATRTCLQMLGEVGRWRRRREVRRRGVRSGGGGDGGPVSWSRGGKPLWLLEWLMNKTKLLTNEDNTFAAQSKSNCRTIIPKVSDSVVPPVHLRTWSQ